jgi:vacuolar-type H+-ATPase subunit I/STV1
VPDKRTSLIINTSTTTEEPESYATPSTPTSVASFSDTTTVIDCNSSISSSKDYYERIKAEEDAALELHFQTQLLKKRELEEARFKQTLKEQEERREQQNKRVEEERKNTHMEFQLKQKQLAEEREKTNLLKRPSRVFDHNSNNNNNNNSRSSSVASTIAHTNNNSTIKKTNSHDAMNNTTITKTNTITTETKKVVVLMSGFVSVQTRNSPVSLIDDIITVIVIIIM